MLIEKLLEDIREPISERTVADVRVGLGYTAVLLDDGGCGLASTVAPPGDHTCTLLADSGELIGKPAADLAARAAAADTIERTVGLAAINALLNRRGEPDPGIDSSLDLDGAVVGMVGHIPPVADAIGRVAEKLFTFDRRSISSAVRGEDEIARLLPTCDVVILTSQTLVNGTVEGLLELTRGPIAMIGPTTPLWDGFAAFGVVHLFGQVVTDAQSILSIVSQAGGTRRFRRAATKVYRQLDAGS